VKYSSCQAETPSDAESCPDCGASLLVPCPQCRTSNRAGNRFCKKCGQALGAARATTEGDRFAAPNAYTPQHLAEKILTSLAALQGERKLVPVEVGRWTAEHITGAQLHALKERCHALPATAPVELAEVVRHFICTGRPT